ncbi:hypothetical protein GJU84_12090 (plasmid) [Staphylococcus chromogenes]|uniref:hypothetical protein n=2 Tax=Staphylococcus chromogenes TaxID=46126 RepID=UPI0010E3AB0B|nr:hypothetical protein [Staphylococcus chromogenes]EAE5933137.1 hypothetical protein [Listeria monocytogenes]QIN27823.1 hypothetical protein GJU84_12090 [Staphylococcus chromogenes]
MNTFHLYNSTEEKVLIVRETFGGYVMIGLPKGQYSHIDGYYPAKEFNDFKARHNLMYPQELGSQISIFDM